MNKRLIKKLIAVVLCILIMLCMCAPKAYATRIFEKDENSAEVIELDEGTNEEASEDNLDKELEELRKRNFKNLTETEVFELPKIIMDELNEQIKKYPGIKFGIGLYSLDGSIGYEYNANTRINGGCIVKLEYALFVLTECEKQNIDIETYTLTFDKYYRLNDEYKSMRNTGSGDIKYDPFGTEYTIDYLLCKLLSISDNTAYNILTTKFSLEDYNEFLKTLDGQNLYDSDGKIHQYWNVSVRQKKNGWLAAYNYITSDSKYADKLREYLSNTFACYIYKGMRNRDEHTFMHKSGWSYGDYYCACDCAIVDENYLLIVLTQNSVTHEANTGAVMRIGRATQKYVNKFGTDDGLLF